VCLCGATPLIASGDIFTKTDAVQIGYLTKCDGICIARGLMNNPFLPLILKEEINKGNDQYNKRYFYNQMNNIAKSFPEYRGKRYFIEIAKMMWGINSKEFKSLNK
jgi:tRNA-dihydrouridine synthase